MKNLSLGIIVCCLSITALSLQKVNQKSNEPKVENSKSTKMKIEIWSDVVCPFCYIGKRKFETALAQFEFKDEIEIVWKSYQLMPEMQTRTDLSVYQMLADAKGISIEQSKQMHENVVRMASQVGLNYNFDKAVSANTFSAHQFLHLAKSKNKQNEAEELLFSAYFTEGKNIDDINTLKEIGQKLEISPEEVEQALNNKTYESAVQSDILEARNIGVQGVPFFVFDRKYAVSGAQDSQTFLSSLRKAHKEWRENTSKSKLETKEGKVCEPNKKCD